jgi:hypothetical protein
MSEDLFKYIIAGAVAGYVPLGVFIYFLTKKLLEAKDKQVEVMRETLLQNEEMSRLYTDVNCVLEKVVALFK